MFSGFICFLLRMVEISQTGTISHYNTTESHSHYVLYPFSVAHTSPGCVYSHPGGSLMIRTTLTHLRSINNTAPLFTDLGRLSQPCRHRGSYV